LSVKHATRPVIALKIHCPTDLATFRLLHTGELDAIDPHCPLGRMIAIVREDGPLGHFGIYRSVIELASGWELFTPSSNARPTLGSAGRHTASPTAVLTLYIPADAEEDAVEAAVASILAEHPWEVPVIETFRTAIVTRA